MRTSSMRERLGRPLPAILSVGVLITTIIREAGGEGEFETVTLGTSAYEALASGRADFTLEVATWEGVNAKLQGRQQRAFRYADYGVPDQHTTFIGTREEWLEANPEAARAFLTATRRGYDFAEENPAAAAEILIETTEGMLNNAELIRASMQAIVEGGYLTDESGRIGAIDWQRSRRSAASCSTPESCSTKTARRCARSRISRLGYQRLSGAVAACRGRFTSTPSYSGSAAMKRRAWSAYLRSLNHSESPWVAWPVRCVVGIGR